MQLWTVYDTHERGWMMIGKSSGGGVSSGPYATRDEAERAIAHYVEQEDRIRARHAKIDEESDT